jgi:DNA-directed RNA polymerase subunit RPC12/RpoP
MSTQGQYDCTRLYESGDTLHYCGFECPKCGFQHRLSDTLGSLRVVDLFRNSTEARQLRCPECGAVTSFLRKDLKLFGRSRE